MSEAIWVFAELDGQEIYEPSLEVICEAGRLADLGQRKLCVILFGHNIEPLAGSLSQYGADTVYFADHELLESYHPELFTDILTHLARFHTPGILLFASTVTSQDLAPRVAGRLRTTLVPNCDKLDISDDGRLLQTRLIHQNTVHSTMVCPKARIQMATYNPGIAKVRKSSSKKDTEVIRIDRAEYVESFSPQIEFCGFIKADPKTIDIVDAELIVSGGKGAEDGAGFELVRKLAEAMNASVAGSRVAVDNQWISKDRQIGQSGKTVSPEFMISCGVSGANAHIHGMRDTKTLIAINKDKAAPIMKLADLGVVGDMLEILPELIKRLQNADAADS